ncbi:hypothetical protein AC249_AIPGENE16324 [Exaiptasia diaphana]|nr:hypothetical protein AC249_AIPGENE16324 [Exaiptasia diaphana]
MTENLAKNLASAISKSIMDCLSSQGAGAHSDVQRQEPAAAGPSGVNEDTAKHQMSKFTCCVADCHNREITGVTFHRFPADQELRIKWLIKIRQGDFKAITFTHFTQNLISHAVVITPLKLMDRKKKESRSDPGT